MEIGSIPIDIDFGWLAATLWPVFVALPGFIAFAWQLKDRREAAKERLPFIAFKWKDRPPPDNPWQGVMLWFRNDGTTPFEVTKLEVLSPRGVELLIPGHSPTGAETVAPRRGSTLTVKWTIPPNVLRGPGGMLLSTQTLLFVGSTRRKMSAVQLSVRLTLSEMSANRRKSRMIVISEPQDINVVRPFNATSQKA